MVDCNYKSPTRSYATIFKTQPWKQAVSTFPQGASPLHLFSKLIFCPHQKKYISTTHQANLPEPESPLEEEKTFWRTLRSDLHEAEVLSGFLLQRWQPLWQGVVGTKVWKAWQGKARRAKVATRRAGPVSASPQASPPATAPCTLSMKILERKETVKMLHTDFANWTPHPSNCSYDGLFNLNKCARNSGQSSDVEEVWVVASPNYPIVSLNPQTAALWCKKFRGREGWQMAIPPGKFLRVCNLVETLVFHGFHWGKREIFKFCAI